MLKLFIMRTRCFAATFAFAFLFNASSATSQTLTEQIISHYNKLNKTEYCQNLIEFYKKDRLKLPKREPPFGNPYGTSPSDSMCLAGEIKYFTNMVSQPDPYFVLKLNIINNQFVVDTLIPNFDLYWLGKQYGSKGKSVDVVVTEDSNFIPLTSSNFFYQATSKEMVTRASKAMREILKKKPFCLLSCDEILALMYMLDGKIYVYDLISMKEYEANFYLQNVYLNSKDNYTIHPLSNDYYAGYEQIASETNYYKGWGNKGSSYIKYLHNHFEYEPMTITDLQKIGTMQKIIGTNGVISAYFPIDNQIYTGNVRNIQFYTEKAIVSFSIGSFKTSSMNNDWRFFYIKGNK